MGDREKISELMAKVLRDNNSSSMKHIKNPKNSIVEMADIDKLLQKVHGNFTRTDISVSTKSPFVYSSIWFTVIDSSGVHSYSKRCGEELEVRSAKG